MNKLLYRLLLPTLALMGTVASCDDDNNYRHETSEDNPPITPSSDDVTKPEGQTAFVVAQGNQGYAILGEVDGLNTSKHTSQTNLFFVTNRQGLGDTPQAPLRYGSRIYFPVFGSNCVWVCDAQSLRAEKQIMTAAPEALCAADGYVFVANNDGYVTRIDTLTMATTQSAAVGPNPAGLAAADGKVYVSISDGYNWQNGYVNGKKVVALDIRSLAVAATYDVPVNPGAVCADDAGRIYVLTRGDYATVMPQIVRLGHDGGCEVVVEGSSLLMDVSGSTLYFTDTVTDWATYTSTTKTYALDLKGQGGPQEINLDATADAAETRRLPASPTFIQVSPRGGHLFIGSLATGSGYAEPGYVYEYQADGAYVYRYSAGVMPFGMVFK